MLNIVWFWQNVLVEFRLSKVNGKKDKNLQSPRKDRLINNQFELHFKRMMNLAFHSRSMGNFRKRTEIEFIEN